MHRTFEEDSEPMVREKFELSPLAAGRGVLRVRLRGPGRIST